ncbi:hypothetical protein HMPREF3189_01677 [Clostridiales bacterium KA00134]|nr:hypothetical protein HMPREF3189_01677 [Clostridiales bacterium KA00134]
MARERRPERDLAFELFRKSKGRLEVKEIAKKLNVKAATVSQWKYRDKWEEKLKEKRRGGQFGNKNAEGAGAPKGNKNAETHGGYSSIDLNNLPEEDQAYISNLSLDTETNFKNELQILLAKEKDIRHRLEALDYEPEDKLYLSRESEMQAVPKPEQLERLEPEERVERISKLQPTLKTITRDSKFERQQKLLVAFDRIHGRIIKLLDSIKTYQLDCKRIELDQQRYELSKEKVKGTFEFDLEDELEDL